MPSYYAILFDMYLQPHKVSLSKTEGILIYMGLKERISRDNVLNMSLTYKSQPRHNNLKDLFELIVGCNIQRITLSCLFFTTLQLKELVAEIWMLLSLFLFLFTTTSMLLPKCYYLNATTNTTSLLPAYKSVINFLTIGPLSFG